VNAKGQIEENLAKAILFIAVFICIVYLIVKIYTGTIAIPAWSRSLSAVDKAIDNLDPDNLALERTASVELGNYFIKGFSNLCDADCICACSDTECSNAANNPKKFCRAIPYKISTFTVSTDNDKPVAVRLGLEKIGNDNYVKVLGLVT
jgi:hypothetical protein